MGPLELFFQDHAVAIAVDGLEKAPDTSNFIVRQRPPWPTAYISSTVVSCENSGDGNQESVRCM